MNARPAAAALLLATAGLWVPPIGALSSGNQAVTLEQVLTAGARYVETYQRAFSAVVSEELYTQRLVGPIASPGGDRRTLRSDVLLMHVKNAGWVTFRDVLEIDATKVRDRDDRLVALIVKPPPDAGTQLVRIAEESARFNLGPVSRTLNTPFLALVFLTADGQPRSGFRLVRTARVDGQATAEVEFTEQAEPRLILTRDNARATGRFWISPDTGAVLRSELSVTSGGSAVKVLVNYKLQERLSLLVPVTMEENYELGGGETPVRGEYGTSSSRIEAHATYTNFRMFNVDTSTIIKKQGSTAPRVRETRPGAAATRRPAGRSR